MKNVFGALVHLMYYSDRKQQIWFLALCALLALLAVLHHFWKKDQRLLLIWRGLCALPLFLCAVHFFIYCSGMMWQFLFERYWFMYLLGVLGLSGIFFAKKETAYRASASLIAVLAVFGGMYFVSGLAPVNDFSRMGYADSFRAMLDEMREHYVLAEWKEVDFDEAEKEFLPLIEEAEREQDAHAFAALVKRFLVQIGDGHVSMSLSPEFSLPIQYREYGLATVLLGSGEVIAVRTGAEANAAGIYDGTVITQWDRLPVDVAIEQMDSPFSFAVADNARFVKAIYLSGTGGDVVTLRYLDKDGAEREASLSVLGEDAKTLRSVLNALRGKGATGREEENFAVKMLSDTCGYLKLSEESTDSLADTVAYLTGVHKPAMRMFQEKLDELSAQGMESLVIDLRGNGGGLDEISLALASLFADEEYFGIGLALGKGGDCRCVSAHSIVPLGAYKDLPVVALTNFDCASAGDGAALYLSKLPNVTLAGITDPNGCDQETGGVCFLSEAGITLMYPTGLVVDENGKPNIDTGADGVSRNPVEVRIPFDREAALRMLAGDDHELEWAMAYLEARKNGSCE